MPHDGQSSSATTAPEPAPRLLVIGGASLDTLHLRGKTVRSAGGAGLYTALAARRAGAQVTMIGPRPDPMPSELEAAAKLIEWRGNRVPPERLPSFEIVHHEHGSSEIVDFRWGAEATLYPAQLPTGLAADLVYCCPLCDPERQLEFIRHFRGLGTRTACGTFQQAVDRHADIVRKTIAEADLFFCNRYEAEALFGDLGSASVSTGKILFITLGADGCMVVQGGHVSHLPGPRVAELDPTGAGDTFCGTALALLLCGEHPVRSGRGAAHAAARMVTGIGPATLLRSAASHDRVDSSPISVDRERIEEVGEILDRSPEASSFDFVGDDYPPVGHPAALDFFFAATLQQFGFWTWEGDRYGRPMVARIGGRELKGSDFLWAAFRRWLDEDPRGLTPEGQAHLDRSRFDHRLRDDRDANPLPEVTLHLEMARAYGHDMSALELIPQRLVEQVGRSARPLQAFLEQLDHVGGYKEDPLRKKSALLAAILRARPERFLDWSDEEIPPIVDYHVQRSCLRIGIVEVRDAQLRRRLMQRSRVDAEDERRIREAVFDALLLMNARTDKAMADLDWFFFQNRSRCPEMTEPQCRECPIDSACAHRRELFQPVYRTTSY